MKMSLKRRSFFEKMSAALAVLFVGRNAKALSYLSEMPPAELDPVQIQNRNDLRHDGNLYAIKDKGGDTGFKMDPS